MPGIGTRSEERLWQKGISDWSQLIAEPNKVRIGNVDVRVLVDMLKQSENALKQENHQFFSRSLGQKDVWRAYDAFKHKCAYVDIETDGGSSGDSITVVGLYDGEKFKAFVRGENLADFKDAISHYSMIVTFFGTGFDMPVLERKYGRIFDQIHFDVSILLNKLGYRGGLKRIEKEFGLQRSEDTDGLNGRDAIRLWNRYEQLGDTESLRILVDYNREDVISLPILASAAYSKMSGLILEGLPEPAPSTGSLF